MICGFLIGATLAIHWRSETHLCMNKGNCLIPFCKQLNVIKAILGKLILMGLVLVLEMKAQNLYVLSQYFMFHLY